MTCAFPSPLAPVACRPLARRALRLLIGAILAMTFTAGIARADPAPMQWQPTTGDLIRSLRPCRMAVSAPTLPVCWSVSEDLAAWMAPAAAPYPWGQCTYYAGLMRPDIWNDRAPSSADPLSDNWDAWTWVEHAQAERLPVDGDPAPGDVMVYSRAAVGNQTGHVAIVDAVDPPDGSAGVELTISEMNVEGLDNPALGQGDTMTVVVPRSQLVPGMIQFVHRPPRGYIPPSWSNGSGAGGEYLAVAASVPPVSADPSLTVGVADGRLETVSESTSPVAATVTAVPGGRVVKRLSLRANRLVALRLPGGSYRVCVAQAPDGVWPAVSDCATGAWQVPPSAVRLHVGRVREVGRRLTVRVVVAVRGPAPARRVKVWARLLQRRRIRLGRRWVVRRVVVARFALRLRRGRQVLRLHLPRRAGAGRRGVLGLRIPAQTLAGYRIAASHVSRPVL